MNIEWGCVKVLVRWVHESGLKDGSNASETGCHLLKKVKSGKKRKKRRKEKKKKKEKSTAKLRG